MSTSNTEYSFRLRDCLIGGQMLFVAFGALVLVPILTGLSPSVSLFTAGVGTLIFQITTKGKVPVFLGSSFAFIAPIIYGVQKWGIAQTMSGLLAAGIFYVLLSFLIRLKGQDFIHKLLPPIVVGPVIMVIGLILAPVAVNMAMGKTGDGAIQLVPESKSMIVSFLALAVTLLVTLRGKGVFKLIPILFGIAAGYTTAYFMGLVDFTAVSNAPWLAMPNFVTPEWNWQAVLFIVPIAIAPAIEHIGDMLAIGSVTGKDYLKEPGLHRSLLGDGLATSFAAFCGGPPNTTYSEVTGSIALTRAFNPAIMTWAALTAIVLAFVGKLGALLQTIPVPVMGGIMTLLFGAIMVVGLNILVKSKEDFTEPRNMAIVSLVVVFAVGGMKFNAGEFALQGIGLAAILAILLNLVLPKSRVSEEQDAEKKSVQAA